MMSLRQTKGDDAHLMEEDMNKTLIAVATATLAIAATVSQAEAGFRIGIGFGALGVLSALSHHSDSYAPRYNHRVYRAERVEERAPVRARKVQPVETSVAQNENSSIAVVAPKVASVEKSSITVASTDETTKVEPVKITETKKTAEAAKAIEPVKTTEIEKSESAVAQKIDCKKFFPSVGLTLTVPCE